MPSAKSNGTGKGNFSRKVQIHVVLKEQIQIRCFSPSPPAPPGKGLQQECAHCCAEPHFCSSISDSTTRGCTPRWGLVMDGGESQRERSPTSLRFALCMMESFSELSTNSPRFISLHAPEPNPSSAVQHPAPSSQPDSLWMLQAALSVHRDALLIN